MIEEILYVARRQIRSIVSLCEEFGDRSKVQKANQNDSISLKIVND